ncbi:MAG TPA: TerC family protein [Bryobacteraceae bacterium]|nr:TerC family protein [Bryobacteraceae bacterium]
MNLIREHWQFIVSLLSIVLVDLTLSGDNAVVIAAAAKTLPGPLRRRAMFAGAACAVITLVVAAFFAARLLTVKFLQIVGGLAVLWIAVGLFREEPPLEDTATHLTSFWKAMWFIIVADVTMSTDNVLAIAALAQGNLLLLLFGLSVSIPLVVFASGLLASLMDRYPIIVYIGAALLGRVAGHMIMTDAYVIQRFSPSPALQYTAQAIGTLGVLAAGFWLKARAKKRES